MGITAAPYLFNWFSKYAVTLTRTVFAFGSPCLGNGQYGHLVLSPNGRVSGYDHPNEHSWLLQDGKLSLLSETGEVTSIFESAGSAWLGHAHGKSWPLYLVPIIELGPRPKSDRSTSIFLNTIPKSGTYYLERALTIQGRPSARLHLLSRNIVDDYRNLQDAEIHVAPERVRMHFPVPLVTQLLCGETVVGHVEDRSTLEEIAKQNVHTISVVRDLRDVLVSLYRFKLNKVSPLDKLDKLWRQLPDRERFLVFLWHYRDADIAHILALAETLQTPPQGPVLRYEELAQGAFPEHTTKQLNAISEGFADELSSALRNTHLTATPTFSGHPSNWTLYWTESTQRYFVDRGLDEANRKLGYF